MEPFAKKGTICKKRAQYAVRTVGRGRNLQEEEGEGTIEKEGAICGAQCREREEFAGSGERGNHLQGEEPLAERGRHLKGELHG